MDRLLHRAHHHCHPQRRRALEPRGPQLHVPADGHLSLRRHLQQHRPLRPGDRDVQRAVPQPDLVPRLRHPKLAVKCDLQLLEAGLHAHGVPRPCCGEVLGGAGTPAELRHGRIRWCLLGPLRCLHGCVAYGILHRLPGGGLEWQGRLYHGARAVRRALRLLHKGCHAAKRLCGAQVLPVAGLQPAGKHRGVAAGRDPDLLLPGRWFWLPHRLCLLRSQEGRLHKERTDGLHHQLLHFYVRGHRGLPNPGILGSRDEGRQPLHRRRQFGRPQIDRPLRHRLGVHRLPHCDLAHAPRLRVGLPVLRHALVLGNRLRVCDD
mmetsp:Transcript_64288/g.188091  ORF Transcript_64288/g.188091 Transcript_64288/m.188091 type:complete len:319 (+) Transcript_64288:464-1420(+)